MMSDSSHAAASSHESHGDHPTLRTYYTIFAALMLLLVATVAVAEVDLGPFGFFAACVIASIKAMLIILFFMHVRYSKPLTWLMAGAGFFWLAILFGLTMSDYISRDWFDKPGPEQEKIEARVEQANVPRLV